MAATRSDIARWLDDMYEDESITHVIVVCDTFDWEDYPVYVQKHEDVKKREKEFKGNMQRVMEVYSRNHSKEEQMAANRAFNYD